MRGGAVFFRGSSGAAARAYLATDRTATADDYYLEKGELTASRFVFDGAGEMVDSGTLNAEAYQGWVEWVDPSTGEVRGSRRENSVLFLDKVINVDKTLSVAAVLDELDDAALMSILCEPKNALVKQYGKLFQMEGAQLEFRDDALKAIASRARERKTGARGLRTIMESILVDVMYDLPSMTNVSKVVVDEAVVRGEVKPFIVYENAEVKRESKKPAA